MGSSVFKNDKDYYILGLWLADGYWWSSSVGISSTSKIILSRFEKFLRKVCPTHPIKEHIYKPGKGQKRRLVAKHLYVNCRPLTRYFMSWKSKEKLVIPVKFLPAYFAGRIDGDGHVDKKHRTGVRIVYGTKIDALRDFLLLEKLGEKPASLYEYKAAKTWVLYFRRNFLRKVTPKIAKYSFKFKNFAP